MSATILIVEDEYAVARGVQYALQQEGYAVTVARSGEEGRHGIAAEAGFHLAKSLVRHIVYAAWIRHPAGLSVG